MSQQANAGPQQVGLFLNPAGQRRVDFQAACGDQFGRLFVADGAEQASHILLQQHVDLLIIDLERFDRDIDLAALGELIEQRNGAPVILVCPFTNASWLAELMAFGPLGYVIGPAIGAELNERVAAQLHATLAGADALATSSETELRHLLAIGARVQQVIVEIDDQAELAERICIALCNWPGVVQAALFRHAGIGELELEAQHSPAGLNLIRILQRRDRLLQSPLRHVFPGLLAACTGEVAYLDAPAKAGEPELAICLQDMGVKMVLGLPILARGPAAPLGAICLMFDRHKRFSQDELSSLAGLAQLAGLGMRMAEMSREGEQLMARLTHLATTDALTGVANRRRGEELLEQEVRRSRRYHTPLALIAFDIDHFRAINDRYGHPCGDVALRTVAEATQAALRSSDMLARSGGEEFQIIAAHTSAIDGLKMAEKLRLAISQTAIPGCDRLTISLAVAQLVEQESADSLVLRVNAALGRAKRAGRNCVELAMQ